MDEPGHVYHMYVVRSPERDRLAEALDGRRDRPRLLLRDAAPPPAGAALPRQKEGSLPETEKAAAENLALPMWAGIPAEVQERVVGRDPRGRGGARVIPINRHRIWQLVADAGLIALAWWLAFELRFDQGVPRYYDTLFRRTILIVVAIKLVVFVAVPLLRPLVAVRLDPRHVVGRARRRPPPRSSPA